jgi:diguanylate cyclase (GGDEF)-like protein
VPIKVPMLERFGERPSSSDGQANRLAPLALGWLFVAGAAIGLISLLLPNPPRADMPGLYSNVALALTAGLALLIGASRVRPWMLHVALLAGAVIITRAIRLSGEPSSFYSVWYIWVGLYAFSFLGRIAATAHVGFVGLLFGWTLTQNPPSSAVGRWLTTMATLVVASIFIDTLVRRARQQASLAAASASSMARVASVAHELAALSESTTGRLALCRGVVRATQAAYVALWEAGHDRRGLQCTGRAGWRPDAPRPGSEVPAGVSQAFGSGCPVLGPSEEPAASPGEVCTWVLQPIIHEQRTVAVLELAFSGSAPVRDPSTTALLNLLAVEAAVTLQRLGLLAELETKALTDELTGLPNRRWWQEQLPQQISRSARLDQPLSVAVIDLDHFKRYNDTHGHQTGDELLREVASAWRAELRPTDLLARHGGEEFVLALPSCPPGQARVVVERLRAVTPDGQSCSAGIACWDGTESVADLIGRADRALYEAKRSGRDRSAVATKPGELALSADQASWE